MIKLWRKLSEAITDNFFAEEFRLTAVVPFLFALGIASFFALPIEPNVWISLGILEIWLLLFYLCRFKNLHYFFIGGLIIICGFLNIQAHTLYQTRHVETPKEQTLTYLRGQIKDISVSAKGKMRLLLHNAADYDNPLKGEFRITVNSKSDDEIIVGKCVEMAATLFPNRPTPILHGFKLDRKYFYENLSAVGYANSEVFTVKCPNEYEKGSFIASINGLRQQIIAYIGSVLPQEQAGVTDALIVGEKTHILPQITDNYRNSGLAHFLSVSGLHLGSIAALVFFAVRLLIALFPFLALRIDSKKIASVTAIIISALYLLMSGMAVPAQRAFIMTTVILIGVLFNRQAISLRMVSFAALAILVLEPQTLVSVSFQMSFAAVYALVAFYETYAAKLAVFAPKQNILLKILWYLCGIVIGDFIASLATLPFALYHFHRVAVYTSLGNLLAGPIIGLWLMPLVLVCLIALPLHLAFYPLKALGYGIGILNNITDYVAHLPHSVWYNNNLPFWGLALIICGAYWLCIWQQPWRRWGIVPIIIGSLTVFIPHKSPDMVFSDKASEIAVRADNGDLLWLPYKRNSWLKEIWQENLQVKDMEAQTQRQFNSALNSEKQQRIDGLDLLCNKESCIYKNKVEFTPNGVLKINGKKANISGGGYIYTDDKVKIEYFTDSDCRIWQNCYKK